MKKTISALLDRGTVEVIDNYYIERDFHEASKKGILDIIQKSVGMNLKEISDSTSIEFELCTIMMPEILNNNRIVERDGRYFTGDSITIEALSDDKKKLLSDILGKSSAGVEIGKLDDDSVKKKVKELIRLGFLVSLDGNIIYHTEIYEELKLKIMEFISGRDNITIPEAKEVTSLSRKFIIPLLNRIEGDGLIKRIGDVRVKV